MDTSQQLWRGIAQIVAMAISAHCALQTSLVKIKYASVDWCDGEVMRNIIIDLD